MIFKKIGIVVASVVFAAVAMADTLEVKENHPTKYIVQKGDTLWDISAKFLKKPWYWPKIWNVNPQINDPHWIYPGDELTLVWIDGKPYVQRATPSVKKGNPIPTINVEAIKTFLKNDLVLPYDEDELNKLPYVMGNNDGRNLLAETTDLFVRGKLNKGEQYGVYHKGELIKDDAGNKLGYKAVFSGVVSAGEQYPNNLTKAFLVKNTKSVSMGDFVLPFNVDTGYNLYFVPKPATVDTEVVALADENSNAGNFDTVILGKGSSSGVKPGDVFSLNRPGMQITGRSRDSNKYYNMDSHAKRLTSIDENRLPDDLVGQVMVYRTYKNVSLAIILKSVSSVEVGYKAVQP